MTANKKERNTQIPPEAIKGAAGKGAKYEVAGISCEKMKHQSKSVETIEDTNHTEYESIMPEELKGGNVTIKAYNNELPEKQVPKNKKQGMGRGE